MSEQNDPNIALLAERKWLEGLLTLRAAVGDLGLGMGAADIHYGRATGYWTLTLRADSGPGAPHGGLPQSELGGLHPELRARITAARAAAGDFRRSERDWLANADLHAPTPDYQSWAFRLEQELVGLLGAIERLSK